jgi:hypothetical protein
MEAAGFTAADITGAEDITAGTTEAGPSGGTTVAGTTGGSTAVRFGGPSTPLRYITVHMIRTTRTMYTLQHLRT